MEFYGMVINLTKDKAIVTTNDFQSFFIKRSPTIYIGQEVEFTEKDIIKKSSAFIKLGLAAACLFVFFTFIACISNLNVLNNMKNDYFQSKVFAYVDIDINPSLEIEIDDKGNVLRLVPLNEDAKILVKKLKLSSISISQAMNIILGELKKNKIISSASNDCILVSSTLNNKNSESDKEYQTEKKKLDNLIDLLKNNIQDKENGKVNVFLIQTNLYERKGAKSEGISTGRYVLYNSYKNLISEFSIEEAKSMKVNELLKDLINFKKEYGSSLMEGLNKNSKQTMNTESEPTSTNSPLNSEVPSQIGQSTPSIKYDNSNYWLAKDDSSKSNVSSAIPSSIAKKIDSQFVKLEAYNYHGHFIQHKSFRGLISKETARSDDAIFKIVQGLADSNCISLESKNYPGYYLVHDNFKIYLKKNDGSVDFKECGTFRKVPGLADKNLVSFQSFNYPSRYLRHSEFYLQIDEIKTDLQKKDATFTEIKQK
ncbi:MAG: AbfB domain-containing protein [Bacillota bacterium]|nr:AbfB domain-containing protein [Bacillota bacterium]